MMNFSLGVVVLAAGESTRMGSPKPLLTLEGRTLLEHICSHSFLAKDRVHPVVVLGYESDTIQSIVPIRYSVVVNHDYRLGRMTSIQCGINTCKDYVDGAFIWPVDCPLVPLCVFEALCHAFHDRKSICIPSYRMKRGHPPLIGAAYFDDILAMKQNHSLRDLYTFYPDKIAHVPVDSETVLHNMNTPDEYERIKEYYHHVVHGRES